MKTYLVKTEEETLRLAAEYAQKLTGGEVVLLNGNLGAGKSVFVRGVARALGVRNRITSPTFVLLKVYPIKNKKIKKLIHVDAYRVSPEDLLAVGLSEYLNNPDTVVMIEWGEKLTKVLKKQKIKIQTIDIMINQSDRKISF